MTEIHAILTDKDTGAKTSLRARALRKLAYTQWDVLLYGIPVLQDGKEVVVCWYTPDIKHGTTFHTDSNGLEMQERKLNYRPTWTLTTNEPISANYYPINTAISIFNDTNNLQMTVSNDRSQGGSVIEDGRIELMQNRRLYYDDSRGVGEALDEIDEYGNGIVTHATYHIQFFNRKTHYSYQREIQIL